MELECGGSKNEKDKLCEALDLIDIPVHNGEERYLLANVTNLKNFPVLLKKEKGVENGRGRHGKWKSSKK